MKYSQSYECGPSWNCNAQVFSRHMPRRPSFPKDCLSIHFMTHSVVLVQWALCNVGISLGSVCQSDVEQFEILHGDWNLKQIFTQNHEVTSVKPCRSWCRLWGYITWPCSGCRLQLLAGRLCQNGSGYYGCITVYRFQEVEFFRVYGRGSK